MSELPQWARAGRQQWQFDGSTRPDFAKVPGSNQELVWDYPRPPRLAPDTRTVIVKYQDQLIAKSSESIRVLETAGGPVFYLPPEHVNTDVLRLAAAKSRCEWKGIAAYWNLMVGDERIEHAAWSYPDPFAEFMGIQGYFSFYPAKLDCFVNDEPVKPQAGGLYGGWITKEIIGPIKGESGTEWW